MGSKDAWETYLISTLIDARIALVAAAVFLALPLVLWCTGRFDLRRRPAALGAACGAAFCVVRWGIWYFSQAEDNGFGVAALCAAFLSVALVKQKNKSG